MRYLVNGTEADLPVGDCQVQDLGDRLAVRSEAGLATALAVRHGESVLVSYGGRSYLVERPGRTRARGGGAQSGEVVAPMPGTMNELLVKVGDTVEPGQRIAVLEAMKTLQPLLAPSAGTVIEVLTSPGDQLADGQIVARIEDDSGKV